MTRRASHSRRDFLRRGSVVVAGAVAAPYLIPEGVLASEGKAGANDRIGIAGIGVGRQGSGVFLSAVGSKVGQAVAIAEASQRQGELMAKKAEKPGAKVEVYRDYRKLLERSDVDAIVTATPDHWRAIVCIHACQAGKDVYAEKPLTLTILEGRRIVEAVRKYKRVLQTGSQQRSDAKCRLGCELVRNGRIGKIKKVIAHNYPTPWECALPAQPVPEGLDWDLWCGPTEPVPYNIDLCTPRAKPGWISYRPYSGGEMTGWGAHGFDQIQWALGMDESGPIEIWTEGPTFAPPTNQEPMQQQVGNKACSQPAVFMRYAGDILMELSDKGPRGGGTFIGEKGTITIDRAKCVSDPPEIAKEPIRDGEIRLAKSDNHMQNWLDCIKSREKPVAEAEIGHRSATVCHLGNIARWAGRRLRWDPVKEVFPDDAEANKFLDRVRRKPYTLPETV